MVAVAIMGVALAVVLQLYTGSLRTVKKSYDYTRAIIYARASMDEALTEPEPISKQTDLPGDFKLVREITTIAYDDGSLGMDVKVTVSWPPSGSFKLKATRYVDNKK